MGLKLISPKGDITNRKKSHPCHADANPHKTKVLMKKAKIYVLMWPKS